LSGEERKAAILNDLWQEYDDLVPGHFEILSGLKTLTTLRGDDRTNLEQHLRSRLQLFYRDFQQFTESPGFLEVLRPALTTQTPPSFHAKCCPSPPFQPICFEYPPAGNLRLVCICIEIMITSVIIPVLKPFSKSNNPLETDVAEYHVYELCRTFSGVESMYSRDPDFLLPAYSTLYVAAFLCPERARRWLWSKLTHLELICPTSVIPVRKILASLWRMPELVKEGFSAWKEEPPEGNNVELIAEDIEIAARIDEGGSEVEGD
jgi:hypothetical protein